MKKSVCRALAGSGRLSLLLVALLLVASTSFAAKMALCVGPPAAKVWHCRHQHCRTPKALPEIAMVTAPHRHFPV